MFIDVSEAFCVLVNATPGPLVFWIVPPEELFVPSPVTVNEPVDTFTPVRLMPLAAPFEVTDRKLIPLSGAPPAVLSTFEKETAVPVVVVTATLFLIVSPVRVPVFVMPVAAPALTPSELTVSESAASVSVELIVGFPPDAIVRGASVNVVPWPQSVRPALFSEVPA